MLMHGLRAAEVLALNPEDVLLSEAQLRVHGKGGKLRFMPLAPETTRLIHGSTIALSRNFYRLIPRLQFRLTSQVRQSSLVPER
jgi:integrase